MEGMMLLLDLEYLRIIIFPDDVVWSNIPYPLYPPGQEGRGLLRVRDQRAPDRLQREHQALVGGAPRAEGPARGSGELG